MNNTYVELEQSINIFTKVKDLSNYEKLNKSVRDAIYATLMEVEKVGLDKVMGSVESANKILETLENSGFKYIEKEKGGLFKLSKVINGVMMSDHDVKLLKENLEKIVSSFSDFSKHNKVVQKDLIFAIYGENKDIKVGDIDWDKLVFYKANVNMTNQEVKNYVSLIKETGRLLKNDKLHEYNEGDLNSGTEMFNNQ